MFRRRRSGVGAPITAPGGINSSRHLMPLMSTLFMLQEWNTSYTKGEKEKMRKYALTMLVAGLGLAASLGSAKAVTIVFDYSSAFSPAPLQVGFASPYLVIIDGFGNGTQGPNVRTVDIVPHASSPTSTATRTYSVHHFSDVTTFSNVSDGTDSYSPLVVGVDHIDIQGDLTGKLSANASGVNFSHLVYTTPTTLTFVNDNNPLKTITIGAGVINHTDVGGPFDGSPNGSLNFSVTTLSSQSTPEPGAMAMVVGMAIPGSLLALRLRRRNK